MTKPNRIFAWSIFNDWEKFGGYAREHTLHVTDVSDQHGAVYVRADIVQELAEALEVYADGCDATETTPCGYAGNMCCMTARAALAKLQEADQPRS